MQDKEGTIETLERQLVQAGIKQKVMQAETEIKKSVQDTKLSHGRSADKIKAESDMQRRLMRKQQLNGIGEQ